MEERDSEWEKEILSLVRVIKQLELLLGNLFRLMLLRFIWFFLPRNDISNDSSTPTLRIKVTIEGQLILIAGAITASRKQTWFTH